jgi:glutamate carboxypeptidase
VKTLIDHTIEASAAAPCRDGWSKRLYRGIMPLLHQPIHEFCAMNDSQLRALLIEWCEINSGSGNLVGLERMRAVLAAEFATLPDAAVEHVTLRGTTARALRVIVRPAAAKQILLSGHYDTVYGAEHPFQRCTVIDGTKLRGPGVADMKGGLVLMLSALRQFELSSHAAELGYQILLTPDEETGSVASRSLLEDVGRSGRCAFALVFEPARANGNLVKSRKGTGIFTLTCHGRAAHAGRNPDAGRNAILALAEYLPHVDALNRELRGVMLNIGSIRGGGAVNIVPDFAAAELNLRISRATDEARVLARLRELAAPINAREGFRLEIAGRFNRPPKEVTSRDEQLFAAWQECARELGVQLSWQDVDGGSDGNLFSAAGLTNLDGLGPVGDHTHSSDEFVHLPSLVERSRIAARFLEKFAASDIQIPAGTPV